VEPRELLKLNRDHFQRPWPRWAKLAAARFLRILFLRFTAAHWMRCFDTGDLYAALEPIFEKWVGLGAIGPLQYRIEGA
jgi:hypothetical protein